MYFLDNKKRHDTKAFLEGVLQEYHQKDYLSSDPVSFVHQIEDKAEQEILAILCATLAYGNVTQIKKSISDLLNRIYKVDTSLLRIVNRLNDSTVSNQLYAELKGYKHRFNTGDDLWFLMMLLSYSVKKYGSVGAHFLSYLNENDETFEAALNHFIKDWKTQSNRIGKPSNSFYYLLTAPEDGSCCKRWCMLLRWMGRKDPIDLGLWMSHSDKHGLKPHQLVMPLDTHSGRICKILKLTRKKTLNWKTAIEITRALKKYDVLDPVKYDFAITRVGILKKYPKHFNKR